MGALTKVWYLFGCLCGKRLVAIPHTQVPVLERFGELAVDPDTRRKLTRISAATVNRPTPHTAFSSVDVRSLTS